MRKRVIIMGAAGRDFHNFNVYYRNNENYEVVAFTATQIPNIEGRRYPAGLAGALYPEGIPIEAEDDLVELIRKHDVEEVVFAYSDVSHEYVMDRASTALAAGADFRLIASCYLGMRGAYRCGQVPDLACGGRYTRQAWDTLCRGASPHALRRSGRSGGSALRYA